MVAINKLLVANRGEIAVRVLRSARALGIKTVAVFSEADANAMHVAEADEAVGIGPAPSADSYLRGDTIIAAAKATGAQAIHPGYGFLSESPDFAAAVVAAGLIFVGPTADAIRAMGLKDGAKSLMEAAGVPVVPGYHGAAQDEETLADEAAKIGYPVLIKARAGGGGKGMRLVESATDFAAELGAAQREAEKSFGDPTCLIEKYITQPRHIEFQVFGDSHGNVIHLFERDCSLQRRHQKVLEEAPAPDMPDEVRAAMGAAAVRAAEAVNYVGAGTVEFIADGSGPLRADGFWFMEMNTRLQVEHPVTEAITRLDLVALQIAVAEGQPLPVSQAGLSIEGHAVEVRIYAEDPAAGFLPATGELKHLRFPDTVRVDTGVGEGDEVLPHYDPMIAKLIAHGPTRSDAFRKLSAAFDQTRIVGLTTNCDFLGRLTRDPDVVAGHVDTGLIARKQDALTAPVTPQAEDYAVAALALATSQHDPSGPFGGLRHFRHFGVARQTVHFEDTPNDPIVLSFDGPDNIVVETPCGAVTVTDYSRDGENVRYICDGVRQDVAVYSDATATVIFRGSAAISFQHRIQGGRAVEETTDTIVAPMPGAVIEVLVGEGQTVSKGAPLLVLEAMKMEHRLTAPRDGQIAALTVGKGDQVDRGALLVSFVAEDTT